MAYFAAVTLTLLVLLSVTTTSTGLDAINPPDADSVKKEEKLDPLEMGSSSPSMETGDEANDESADDEDVAANMEDNVSTTATQLIKTTTIPPPTTAPSYSHLPQNVTLSAKECTRKFSYTEIVGGLRSSSVVIGAGFEGGGRETTFPQFNMVLKTHCNFIFYPTPPFDSVAVKVDYYRSICRGMIVAVIMYQVL